MSDFDPDKLRLTRTTKPGVHSSPPTRPPRHKKGEKFLRGPIPLDWLTRAAALPGKAPVVGLALWFEAGITKNATVSLTNTVVRRFSVTPKTRSRCLRALESAEWVSVVRDPGRCPVVTILAAPAKTRDSTS